MGGSSCAGAGDVFILSGSLDARTQRREDTAARIDAIKRYGSVTYEVEAISGADHQRQYSVRCSVLKLNKSFVASASSRRGAEKAAAQLLLADLAQDA